MRPLSINLAQIQLYGYLDANCLQKIFPQEYTKKFASHLKILQFQKKILDQPPQTGKLKFTKRSNTTQNLKSLKSPEKTKISKFAHVQDTVLHDRAQITRFKNIAKNVTENINNHEAKAKLAKQKFTNQIKTINNNQEIEKKVIDDMLIESSRETNEKIKQKLEKVKSKQVFCKFIKRNKQKEGKDSYKSRLQWPQMRRYHSQRQMESFFKKNLNLYASSGSEHKNSSIHHPSLQKRSKFLNSNTSQIQENKNKSRTLLSPFNTTKKNRIKSTQFITTQKIINKQDLVEQTKKLKDSKNQLKSILYSKEVGKKVWEEIAENIFPKSNDSLTTQNQYLRGFST